MDTQNSSGTQLDTTNVKSFIIEVDKMQRMGELKNDVMKTLKRIRALKQELSEQKEYLKTLLNTKVEEDKEMTDLLNEIA